MNEIRAAEQELIDEFSLLDNWVDRYQYIIDLGRQLPPFPDEWKDEAHKVHGCQSQVWLHTEMAGGRLRFQAVSDSAIVSGLIAILRRVYDDRPPADIVRTSPDFIAALGLDQHLSPTRSNGLAAMIGAIKHAAAGCASG